MAGMEDKFSLEPSVTKSMAGCEGSSPKPCTATKTESMGLSLLPLTAQAEEEALAGKEAFKGCGSKRKAEEEDDYPFQKEAAVVVIREQYQGADSTADDEVWDDGNDYDSEDDPETVLAKVTARFEAVVQRNMERLPWLKYEDYSAYQADYVHDDDDGSVVDGLVPA